MSNEIKNVLKALHLKPIAYYPIYLIIAGSISAGVALSQLMYWFGTGRKKIYKTDRELQAETGLTDNEMRSVKKKLRVLEFLTLSREGVPARTYYELDWDRYYVSLVKFTNQDSDNSANSISQIHSTITEITQETTTDISFVADKSDDDNLEVLSVTMIEALEVSKHLLFKIEESIDGFKQPNKAAFKKWSNDIDLAIRIDGRSKKQLIDVIDWIHNEEGSFWMSNILSGKKLREKFDQLNIQRSTSKSKTPIKTRVVTEFGTEKVFITFPDKKSAGKTSTKVCIYGQNNALYDYGRNAYIDKDRAVEMWKSIETNFEKLVANKEKRS